MRNFKPARKSLNQSTRMHIPQSPGIRIKRSSPEMDTQSDWTQLGATASAKKTLTWQEMFFVRVCVCVCWDVDRGLCRSGAEAKNRKYSFFSHHNEETEKMAEGNARAEQEMWGWKTCLSCPWPCASLPTQNIWGSIWLWHKLYNLQWFSAYNNPVYEPSSRKYLLSI